MRKIFVTLSLLLFAGFVPALNPISLDNFDDAVHHWQMGRSAQYARYAANQIREIGDNIILLQHNNGGWVQNLDPARILTNEEIAQYQSQKNDETASFDNRNIYSQIEYLMAVYAQTGDEKYKSSAILGLDYVLAQQIPNCGGWPHSLPPTQSYHHKITIADEVFSGNLGLLRNIAFAKAPFQSLDTQIRHRATDALNRGDECLLRLQIRQNGILTGWAGQYDPITLAPSQGRRFELPAIVSQETVEVLRYLMSIEQPSAGQIDAIESGVAWLRRSQITGIRYETFNTGENTQFQYHTTNQDRRLVADSAARPLWARFYDLNDNSVVLATRDGVRVAQFSDIPRERRTGYSWYGYWPQPLLAVDYIAWKRLH